MILGCPGCNIGPPSFGQIILTGKVVFEGSFRIHKRATSKDTVAGVSSSYNYIRLLTNVSGGYKKKSEQKHMIFWTPVRASNWILVIWGKEKW